MGIIFLSGGGDAEDSTEIDRVFVQRLPGPRILYIPVGLIRGYAGYDGCFEWLHATLARHAAVPLTIRMWVHLAHKAEQLSTENFDGVYIGGASSTYRLMRELRRFNIDAPLAEYIKHGGIVYGGSSGAVIFGQRIDVTGDEKRGPADSDARGLGFLGGYSIFCHFDASYAERLSSAACQWNTKIAAISEKTGLLWDSEVNDFIRSTGERRIQVFEPKTTSTADP